MWSKLPPPTRDWTEDDWEQYFLEQDRLWNKAFGGELYDESSHEQFMDMLDSLDYGPSVPNDETLPFEDDDIGELFASSDTDEDEADDEMPFAGRSRGIDAEFPAYRAAYEFGICIQDSLMLETSDRDFGPRDYLLYKLATESESVQDYLASGHQMGYSEDRLCGNIALCRRALSAIDRCILCIERLYLKNGDSRSVLMKRAHITRAFLLRRITSLRELIWWR